MTLTKRTTLLAAVAIALVAVAGGKSFLTNYGAAVADARTARGVAALAVARAEVAQADAADARRQAHAFDSVRVAAVKRAAASEQRASHYHSVFDSVAAVSPDTCFLVIETADSALAAKDSVITDLHVALDAADSARTRIEISLDTTQSALRRLQSAASGLIRADIVLEKKSRPSFLARIIPHPGFGAAIGPDGTGVPRVIFGVTFGWSL